MLTCRESARLLSERRDRRLSWRQRLALRMHIAACRLCKVYATHLAAVSRIAGFAAVAAPDRCPGALAAERKRQIKDALSKESS
jgi:hypothetical protein